MHVLPATEILAALRARQVSSAELVERAIARIETLDGQLNAVVVRDFERARAAAAKADQDRASGDDRPLLGLPVTVKEAHDVEGLATTWAIPGASYSAVADSVAVSRLKAAGAIVLGKTNVPTMLADWQSANPIWGATSNPWDLSKTAGGSSGGGAAALAAGFAALELGTDLNGSLRAPASFCGVFAHKPTYGLVPTRGMAPPFAPRLSVDPGIDLGVVGPMARSAGDLALAMSVLAGPDAAQALGYGLNLPLARHTGLADFRVLVLVDHPHLTPARAVSAAVEAFAAGLEAAGCQVSRSSPLLPDLAAVQDTFALLLAGFIGSDVPDDAYRGMQAAGLPMAMSHRRWVEVDRARWALSDAFRRFFTAFDVIVAPVMPTPAFGHDHRPMGERTLAVDGRVIPYADQSVWPSLATLAGLPATAMPVGLSAAGLPVGVQIVGPYLEDRTTLAFAAFAEAAFGGFVPPPAFAD